MIPFAEWGEEKGLLFRAICECGFRPVRAHSQCSIISHFELFMHFLLVTPPACSPPSCPSPVSLKEAMAKIAIVPLPLPTFCKYFLAHMQLPSPQTMRRLLLEGTTAPRAMTYRALFHTRRRTAGVMRYEWGVTG